jgi:hypothetical protein
MFAALNPAFLSVDNIVGILHRMATVGIMAEGMTFVVMTGGIDLSLGPVLAISGADQRRGGRDTQAAADHRHSCNALDRTRNGAYRRGANSAPTSQRTGL